MIDLLIECSSFGGEGARQLRQRASAGGGQRTGGTDARIPADIAHFTGRHAELKRLRDWCFGSSSPRVVVIHGSPGCGKSSLAVHFGHRSGHLFPDGRILIDLQTDNVPIALGQIVRNLGLPGEYVPRSEEELAGLYQSMVQKRRRLLLILDGARSADQVRRLLPRSPESAVIVTARHPLPELNAVEIGLDRLHDAEARDLIASVAGIDLEADERIADLARLCGNHPLALQVGAARFSLEGPAEDDWFPASPAPEWVSAPEPDQEPGEQDPDLGLFAQLRPAFLLTYNGLPASLQRMFRFLGLSVGPDFSVEACAALLDVPSDVAARGLADLERAHLVIRTGQRRFRQHQLLKQFAGERLRLEETATIREAALERLLDSYYKLGAQVCGDQLGRYRRTIHREDWVEAYPSADVRAQNLSWFEGERRCLVDAAKRAAQAGMYEVSYQIADACFDFFELRRYGRDNIAIHKAGQQSAQIANDGRAVAVMRYHLSVINHELGNNMEAIGFAEMAREAAVEHDDSHCHAVVLNHLAIVYDVLGRYADAVKYARQALQLHETIGSQPGEAAKAFASLAKSFFHQASYQEAWRNAQKAQHVYRAISDRRREADVLITRAHIWHERAKWRDSLRDAQQALHIRADLEDTNGQAAAHVVIARAHHALREQAEGLDHARAALDLCAGTGDLHCEGEARVELGKLLTAEAQLGLAMRHFSHALHIQREIDHLDGQVTSLNGLGFAHYRRGHYLKARECLEQALALAREFGYRPGEARALESLARVLRRLHHCKDALFCGNEALEAWRRLGHEPGQASAWGGIARARLRTGDAGDALKAAEHALRIRRKIGEVGGIGIALDTHARIMVRTGELEEALRSSAQSISCLESAELRFELADAMRTRARVLLHLGKTGEANRLAGAAWREAVELGDRHGQWEALELRGLICQRAGKPDEALAHLRKADTILTQIGDQGSRLGVLELQGEILRGLGDEAGARRCANLIKATRWLA